MCCTIFGTPSHLSNLSHLSNPNNWEANEPILQMLLRHLCRVWGWNMSFLLLFNHSVVSNSLQPHVLWPTRLFCPWDVAGKNTGVDYHFLLHGIISIQGSNLHLSHLLQQQMDSLPLHYLMHVRTTKQSHTPQSSSLLSPYQASQISVYGEDTIRTDWFRST